MCLTDETFNMRLINYNLVLNITITQKVVTFYNTRGLNYEAGFVVIEVTSGFSVLRRWFTSYRGRSPW